jgi:hypothetical protein
MQAIDLFCGMGGASLGIKAFNFSNSTSAMSNYPNLYKTSAF